MDIMEAILREDKMIEQTECNIMQSVAVDKNRSAKESEVTNVDTKVKYIKFYVLKYIYVSNYMYFMYIPQCIYNIYNTKIYKILSYGSHCI